jgi:hypothetical protein
MAEGMAEVADDDDDRARALLLGDILALTGKKAETASWPLSVELSPELAEVADIILENCFDNAGGMKPTDEGAEDFLFEGQVTVVLDPPDPPTTSIPLTEPELKVLAALVFRANSGDVPELTHELATTLLEKFRHATFSA